MDDAATTPSETKMENTVASQQQTLLAALLGRPVPAAVDPRLNSSSTQHHPAQMDVSMHEYGRVQTWGNKVSFNDEKYEGLSVSRELSKESFIAYFRGVSADTQTTIAVNKDHCFISGAEKANVKKASSIVEHQVKELITEWRLKRLDYEFMRLSNDVGMITRRGLEKNTECERNVNELRDRLTGRLKRVWDEVVIVREDLAAHHVDRDQIHQLETRLDDSLSALMNEHRALRESVDAIQQQQEETVGRMLDQRMQQMMDQMRQQQQPPSDLQIDEEILIRDKEIQAQSWVIEERDLLIRRLEKKLETRAESVGATSENANPSSSTEAPYSYGLLIRNLYRLPDHLEWSMMRTSSTGGIYLKSHIQKKFPLDESKVLDLRGGRCIPPQHAREFQLNVAALCPIAYIKDGEEWVSFVAIPTDHM